MIIATLGKLSVAQDLTDADQISENVIQLPAIDYAALTDVWWVVDTETVQVTDDTIKFSLVMGDAVGLDGTNVEVASVLIAGTADKRTATVGRHIAAMDVGKMLKEMLETDGSTYPFIGMLNDLATSVTISINAVLSPTEPPTIPHKMTTVSNVTIPTVASAGSGL